MKILLKEGVIIGEINTPFFHTCVSVYHVFSQLRLIPVITCGREGTHMKNSLHYKNLAWDWRMSIVPEEKREWVRDEIKKIINARQNDYDVVLERSERIDSHGNKITIVWLHTEYDPKGD